MNKAMATVTRISLLVISLALSACGGSGNGGGNQPPPPDVTAPTVSTVTVPAGSTVNRVVTLSATASDTGGVADVRFLVDGTVVGNDTTSPYSFDWDTSTVADGDHQVLAEAQDAAGNVAQSAEVTVTVANVVQFSVALSGEQEVPAVDSAGTAQADITANVVTGEVTGTLTISGITATDAHIHDNFAGANGGVLIALDQDAGDPNLFTVPAAATLDAAGIDRLLAGALYVNAHTAAVPSGEIRGQILPEDFLLRFAALEGFASVPSVDSRASGRAAITLNEVTGALVVQAYTTGLDDATQAHVHEAYAGNTGPVLVALIQDATDPGRWAVEDGVLNASGLDAFAAGRLYVNVHSPANQAGEVRGQILPDGIDVIFADMSGGQEVPAVDTNAKGLAALTLDEAASVVTIHANTTGLADASDSHLHNAFGGDNGGVEIGLTQDGTNPEHWFAEEQSLDAAQLAALLAGSTYVNVHSPDHPGGEIRGQVIPDGILFAYGTLEGAQEVPPVASLAGGTFAVTVDPAALTLVANANTTGADDATAAHLHEAYAGTSGPVAIGLVQDATDVSRWSADNVSIGAGELDALSAGRLYVNVHTPANPPGEVRGQVAPAPIEVLFTALDGGQEVPPVVSAATATAASTVNRDTGLITLHLRETGADDAIGAHIHGAYAGQNGGVVVGLTQDAGDVTLWSAVEAQLDEAGLADYLAGRFYVNLHTPANQPGEVRGQIAPRDVQVVFGDMTGDQVVPAVATAASGNVATTTNLRTRNFVAFVNTIGADDATSAGVHAGNTDENGAEILPLQQTPGVLSQWSAMTDPIDAANFSEYRAGRLYAQVATPAQINGELRGRIDPPGAAEFDNQAPAVTLNSPGDPVEGTVSLTATASDDRGVSEVRFFVDGALIGSDTTDPYSFDWDTTTVANGQVTLTAEAEDAAGNIGTSANVVTTVNNPAAVTLAEIQASVFGPRCSGCHSGPTSGNLPSGMDLSSANNSHAALVNQPSLQQQGALDRVEPGDPDNSYLIRKLEGGPNISGGRMPQGGPFLDQATVDTIRQWISDGAPNN